MGFMIHCASGLSGVDATRCLLPTAPSLALPPRVWRRQRSRTCPLQIRHAASPPARIPTWGIPRPFSRPAMQSARLTSNWHVSLNLQETPLSNIMQHLDIQGDMQIRCEEGRLDGTWVLTPLSLSARRDFPISLTGGGEREKGRIGFAHIEVRRVRLGATCEDGDDDRD